VSININDVVGSLADYYRQMVGGQIIFDTVLCSQAAYLYVDEVQFRRVLENVIQNAIDAIDTSGHIRLTTSVAGEDIIFTCQDDGSGIAEEAQKRLFQPHFTTKVQGSGLGLANVKRIIEDYNGSVELQSEHGKGTTVTIKMPLDPGKSEK
jgi:signal transduction histidine kinase